MLTKSQITNYFPTANSTKSTQGGAQSTQGGAQSTPPGAKVSHIFDTVGESLVTANTSCQQIKLNILDIITAGRNTLVWEYENSVVQNKDIKLC